MLTKDEMIIAINQVTASLATEGSSASPSDMLALCNLAAGLFTDMRRCADALEEIVKSQAAGRKAIEDLVKEQIKVIQDAVRGT